MLIESLGEPVNFLFNYQTELLGQKRSAPIVIKGSRRWIEQFIPLKEFGDLFGGYVLWRPPDQKTAQMPDEAVGVWGNATSPSCAVSFGNAVPASKLFKAKDLLKE